MLLRRRRTVIVSLALPLILAAAGAMLPHLHDGHVQAGREAADAHAMDEPQDTAEPASEEEAAQWYCPMHADVVSDHEGTCPICGMKLVQRKMGGVAPGHSHAFHVAPEVQERIGVVIERVEPTEFRPSMRVPAQVIADERRAVSLSPKVEGWIKRLGVSVVGQRIHPGQTLFEIYSPELQQRQRDYLDLLTRRDALLSASRDPSPDASGGTAPDLMLASVARERYRARARLAAADVPEAILEDLDKYRRVHDVVPVLAQHAGVITQIGAREGAYVMPAQTVVSYADLSAPWAELLLDPEQLAHLDEGAEVEVSSTVDGTTTASAHLDASLAVVDSVSRTARIRVHLPSGTERFLPGTLLDARILMSPRQALVVQNDAVMRTGHGDFVMVADDARHFRQTAVRLGAEEGERVEVTGGLQPGDRIVTNGQFLLSAEASLQAARQRLAGAESDRAMSPRK